MKHCDLVRLAERWLRTRAVIPHDHCETGRQIRCRVVLTEQVCAQEIPDAIGWAIGGRFSVLVECKTSRADFLADALKPWRTHPYLGMGRFRYYMAPEGIIDPHELTGGWGLIEVKKKRTRVLRIAKQHYDWNRDGETQMLWSALRRVQESRVTETA